MARYRYLTPAERKEVDRRYEAALSKSTDAEIEQALKEWARWSVELTANAVAREWAKERREE